MLMRAPRPHARSLLRGEPADELNLTAVQPEALAGPAVIEGHGVCLVVKRSSVHERAGGGTFDAGIEWNVHHGCGGERFEILPEGRDGFAGREKETPASPAHRGLDVRALHRREGDLTARTMMGSTRAHRASLGRSDPGCARSAARSSGSLTRRPSYSCAQRPTRNCPGLMVFEARHPG